MDKINIGSCPICGGHDFSPLAANQYMCTQCGYVMTGNSEPSQAPMSSSDSSQDSLCYLMKSLFQKLMSIRKDVQDVVV